MPYFWEKHGEPSKVVSIASSNVRIRIFGIPFLLVFFELYLSPKVLESRLDPVTVSWSSQ